MKQQSIITAFIIIAIMLYAYGIYRIIKLHSAQKPETTTTVVHHIYDTTARRIIVPYPVLQKSHRDSFIVTPAGPVDTASIIKSYFTTHNYEWNFRDTALDATIHDSIGFNRLLARKLTYKLIKPTTVITNTTTIETHARIQFYGGLRAMVWQGQVSTLTPVAGVRLQSWYIDAGFDLVKKHPVIGVYRKIP